MNRSFLLASRGLAVALTVLLVAEPLSHPVATAATSGPPAELERMWTRYGTGMVTDVVTGDFDADGTGEVVVGGRGTALLDSGSLDDGHYMWANKWYDPAGETVASDGQSVEEMHVEEVTGDGIPDLIVGSDRALFAVDGRGGATLWMATDESGGTSTGAHEVATADLNGDGIADAAFAELLDDRVSAVDGTDGSLLWTYHRPLGFVSDLAAGDLNGDGFNDIVVAGQVDAGIEIHAISGALANETGVAAPLWVQTFPAPPATSEARPGSVAIAQVEPGLFPEVVVGGNGALVVLEGATGLPRSQRTFEGTAVANVEPLQLDADDQLEIAAVAVNFDTDPASHSVRAFDSDTTPLGTYASESPLGEIVAADTDGDERPEMIVGGGWQAHGGRNELDGFVAALRLGTSDELVVDWRTPLPEDVDRLAVGEVFGEPTIVAGQLGPLGEGGGLFALDLAGRERWSFRTGGRVEAVEVADLDGDGGNEIIEGAEDAHLAVHNRSGALRWTARVPGQGGPAVKSLAVGDLGGAAGAEVAAGTFELDPSSSPGKLHVYSARGARLWSRSIAGVVDGIEITDLDTDGVPDVVIAAAAQSIGDPTGLIGRYTPDGEVVWERPAPTGQGTSLELSDVTSDRVADLLVTRNSVFHGGAVLAYDGASGDALWSFERPLSVLWASVTASPKDGITTGDLTGAVFRLDSATGEIVWEVDPGSASWGGEWSADVDGDGLRDVLSASHEGAVRMLAGATGEVLWEAETEGNPAYSVATLHGGAEPVIAVGELGQGTYARAHLLLFGGLDGTRLGVMPTHGPVLDVAAGNLDSDPVDEVVAGAGWQITAADARGMALPEPAVTVLETTAASAAQGQYSDRARLEAQLTDAEGKALEGHTVTFDLTGPSSTRSFAAATDPDGIAAVSPKLLEKPGTYDLTLRFAGTDDLAPSSSEGTFTVTREDTALALSVVGKGKTRKLKARLSDEDSLSGVAGRTVRFYARDELLGKAKTDARGAAKILLPSRYRGRRVRFEANFRGDGFYLPSDDTLRWR